MAETTQTDSSTPPSPNPDNTQAMGEGADIKSKSSFSYGGKGKTSAIAKKDVPVYGGPARVLPRPFWYGWGQEGWRKFLLATIILLGIFSWLFIINLKQLYSTFYNDPTWGHGFLVPVFSALIIYLNADKLRGLKIESSWLGLGILIFGILSLILYLVMGQSHMANVSMLVVLYGGCLFILGWRYMKVLWLPIAYLLFMIPPPNTLYVKLTTPMQHIAAWLGQGMLPFFGVEAAKTGTILQVRHGHGNWSPLNVAEACSGIRSLITFCALAVILAYTTKRPIWQKIFLSLCAVPVAIFCNSFRVTLTGVFQVYFGQQYAEGTAHGMLGFMMFGLAALLQIGIALTLDRIWIEEPTPATTESQGEGKQ